MKLTKSALQKWFTVKHKGKTYYVDYANSDGQTLLLSNRNYWEILDEELEELNIYVCSNTTKKELKQIDKNVKLYKKLIKFCIKHFNDYQPNYKEDC